MSLLADLRALLRSHPEGLDVDQAVALCAGAANRRQVQNALSFLAWKRECARLRPNGDDGRRRLYRLASSGLAAAGAKMLTPSGRAVRVVSVSARALCTYLDGGGEVMLKPSLLRPLPKDRI